MAYKQEKTQCLMPDDFDSGRGSRSLNGNSESS